MPRPGSPAPGAAAPQGAAALLAKFDPEVRADLQRRLSEGSTTAEHITQLYRLLSSTQETRDAEDIADLLDQTATMTADEFRRWVDDMIARSRDQ